MRNPISLVSKDEMVGGARGEAGDPVKNVVGLGRHMTMGERNVSGRRNKTNN